MPLRPIRYEEDRTGLNPNNLVPNEEHVLPVVGKRFLVTKRGPFFTESVEIYDKVSGRRLVPHIDFVCIQLEEEQTLLSGKEVCSVIVILAEDVTQSVLVTYQAYGGWLSYSVTAIIEMVEALNLDEREVSWRQIVGIPDRLPPAPHRHPLSDIYGWHKLFPGLGAIRDAIITGNQPLMDAFREGIQIELDNLSARIGVVETGLDNHIQQTGNVHNLHIHQIDGLLQSEIMDLLSQRLPIQGTAYDTARVYGRTQAQFPAWVHTILNYNQITAGVVPAANRANGYNANVQDQIVTSTGYQSFKNLLDRHLDAGRSVGVYWAGAVTDVAAMRLLFANNTTYPAPTLVAYSYRWTTTHGYGNGGTYTVSHSRSRIDMKVAAGSWANISDS